MSTGFVVYIMIQFIASVALIYGYMHEKKVIAFEDKLLTKIKAALRGKKGAPHNRKKQEENDLAQLNRQDYAPYGCFDHVA